ncbi:MAG: acyl-CoA dehydrogenase family protein [Xanthomonadales bacterium]|nr:acyl-CoA dehydrogenase family protein [Xanthomonadales bacterium]
MNRYAPPLGDMRFVLHRVLGATRALSPLPRGEGLGEDVFDAVLEEAGRFAEQVLAPTNQPGDEEGCRLDRAAAAVSTPRGFREAYARFVEGGWTGLTAPAEYGGQDLPLVLGAAVEEMLDAANLAWSTYPLLSHGAKEALLHHGEEWQKEVFLRPIVAGRWTGTMCLTEPQAGSDLGLLRTRAEPDGEGGFAIHGTKIFITAGEHDLAENIVHLVLARLPDAPPGTRGISLFIVPKFRVGRDGIPGERNRVFATGLEHKMGLKGSATCVMNFEGAAGHLVGEPHQGLRAMFTMMNTARLGVGVQGLGLMERAYQNALAYARERLQMRALGGPRFPDRPADPIVVHPDVRRMLLTQKALIEGGRALAYHAYLQADLRARHPEAAARARAEALLSFLTPIVKGCLTEWAVECCHHALQCFGGHGYIREWGMEQLARDARITTIYEGTTQIQALDLLGRKILQLKGEGLRLFASEVEAFLQGVRDPALAELRCRACGEAAASGSNSPRPSPSAAEREPEEIGAAAVDYLFYSGYLAVGYFWLRRLSALDPAAPEPWRAGQRATARFYFARLLPRCDMHRAAIGAGRESLMAITEEGLLPR